MSNLDHIRRKAAEDARRGLKPASNPTLPDKLKKEYDATHKRTTENEKRKKK